jgi:hypothetical protein
VAGNSRFLSGMEALELEDSAVVLRQILFGMPRRGTKRLQSTITSKSNSCRDIVWGVNLGEGGGGGEEKEERESNITSSGNLSSPSASCARFAYSE